MDINNPAVQRAAEQFATNLEKYPIEEQIAVSCISKNVINGCSWEFVRNTSDLRRNMDAFRNSKTCELKEVTYSHNKKITGYLVLMSLDRLIGILSKEGFGVFDQKDLEKAKLHRQDAIKACATLMQKGYRGRIGIYCTNDSKTITVDGTSYPAFAVTLPELCDICTKMGYGFLVGGKARSPLEIKDSNYPKDSKRIDDVIKSCIVAPSSNALFIDIAPMR